MVTADFLTHGRVALCDTLTQLCNFKNTLINNDKINGEITIGEPRKYNIFNNFWRHENKKKNKKKKKKKKKQKKKKKKKKNPE